MMRAMVFEFPDDPACATLDAQYLLGPALLAAPVLAEDGQVDFYLPDGHWTHLLSGEVRAGGRWHRARYDFFSLPLFARPHAIVPFGAVDDRPDYDFAAGVTFRVFGLADGDELHSAVPDLTGATALRLAVRRAGRRVTATVEGASQAAWQLQLAGARAGAGPQPAGVADDPRGVVLSAAPGVRRLEWEMPAPAPQ